MGKENEERGTGNGERGTGEWGNRGTSFLLVALIMKFD